MAAPITITVNDTYIGGRKSQSSTNQVDVIGDANVFGVSKAELTRPSVNEFQIKIFTNYAGKQGTAGALGTEYGDLFLDQEWRAQVANPGDSPWAKDLYQSGDWEFAFVMDNNAPGSGNQSGAGSLYIVDTGAPGITYGTNSPGVIGSDGGVQLAFVDPPGSTPLLGTSGSGWVFRDGQPVQYNPINGQQAVASGTWEVNATDGWILYTIFDNGVLGGTNKTDFGFSWAMTCANDMIQGWGQVPIPPIPVPGALVLMISALAGLGGLAYRKRIAAK